METKIRSTVLFWSSFIAEGGKYKTKFNALQKQCLAYFFKSDKTNCEFKKIRKLHKKRISKTLAVMILDFW